MNTRPLAALQVLLLGMLISQHVTAQVDYGHNPPVTHAAIEFAPDFPALQDSEWGIPLGGFGGTRAGEPPGHVPVVFVHGNNVDACDWKLVRDDFRAAGWSDQALWALSYNGLGNDVGNYSLRPDQRCRDEHAARNGGDSISRITANEINTPDLYAFILAVREYTGSERFSIVAHSLGVTVARKTLQIYPELREDLLAFVAIAGGNHGTTLCSPGSEYLLYGCDELTPGSAWLADLNGPDGADETYPPARWLTIYDGSGTADGAYAPPDQHSPRLEGADNREYPGTAHNGLRVEAEIVAQYRQFLEAAESVGAASTGNVSQSGGGGLAWPGVLALGLLLLRGRRPARRGLCLLMLCATTIPAQALAPAKAEFPDDFPVILDSEHGFALGGFGGQPDARPSHAPVIFVHGNTADACDWKLVRDDFRAAGWNDQSLWALSYNGVGASLGDAPARSDPRCQQDRAAFDGLPRVTSNDINVDDLAAFIRAVLDYTGSRGFALVGHSLGVTLARRTLQLHPDLAARLQAFVGIAGGNHGTSLCPAGSEKAFPGCAEMAATGSAWLERLNGANGEKETWPGAHWMTIYDGSGEADVAYRGALAQSPTLQGADNRAFPGTPHNDLRVRTDIVAVYRRFLERALAPTKRPKRRLDDLIGK